MNKILCVIPARGGSKGILRKNMYPLSGVPLVAYSIRQAKESGIPHKHIVVSSDDDEILSLARTWGVISHRRPLDISGDLSPSEATLIDALSYGDECDSILMLQPTSPIRLRGRIAHAIQRFRSEDYDSLVSTTKFYNFMWYQTMDLAWHSTYDPQHRPMRQQLPIQDILHFDCGNIYITKKDLLLNTRCRLGGKVCVYTVSQVEGIQIDTMEDMRVVEKILQGNTLLLRIDG